MDSDKAVHRRRPEVWQELKMSKSFSTKAAVVSFFQKNGFLQDSEGNWFQPGTYVCSHGEYERPDFCPRRYKDGWGIHASYYYYQGTFYAPQDGRVSDDFFYEMS